MRRMRTLEIFLHGYRLKQVIYVCLPNLKKLRTVFFGLDKSWQFSTDITFKRVTYVSHGFLYGS